MLCDSVAVTVDVVHTWPRMILLVMITMGFSFAFLYGYGALVGRPLGPAMLRLEIRPAKVSRDPYIYSVEAPKIALSFTRNRVIFSVFKSTLHVHSRCIVYMLTWFLTWFNLATSQSAYFFATTLVIIKTSKPINTLLALIAESVAESICTAIFMLSTFSLK